MRHTLQMETGPLMVRQAHHERASSARPEPVEGRALWNQNVKDLKPGLRDGLAVCDGFARDHVCRV
jgi:hypothetical protein